MSPHALLAAALLVSFGAAAQQPPTDSIEARIDALIAQMTLEEKVGQMTQITLGVVSRSGLDNAALALDRAKLDTAILKYKVGSMLGTFRDTANPPAEFHAVLNAIQDRVEQTPRKIPVLYGIDSIHGANYVTGATLFPQAIALAATWTPALAERAGAISAFQTRAAGIPWVFYPVLDVGRQPLWPRFWETFGEDALLVRDMGRAYIRGLQGDSFGAPGKVAACLKHYAGYSIPFNGKDRTPAILDERTLRQIHLPPFEAGVKAGVMTVMVNSGEISGVPGHANYHLLTEILKQEWRFPGFVVSDWADIERLHARDHVAESPREAVRMAVNAGLDMSMVPGDYSFPDLLIENVKLGLVPMSRIDDAVRRILRVKFVAGLFEHPRPDPALIAQFDQPAFAQANLEAAREAITLLKNSAASGGPGVLPLPKNKKVLVTGPAANLRSVLNGGWSTTWLGDREELYPAGKPTVLEAIQAAVGAENVTYVPGTGFDRELDIPAAVAAAAGADAIVAVIGERTYCEVAGNINDLTLEAAQLRLVAELARTRKPIVTVLVEGRPRVIHGIVPLSDAIVMAYLPGLEGGRAIADVLFGDVNPSGKLPFTYPAGPNGFTTYDYKWLETGAGNFPAWEFPFGHGLSYTTFEYSNLTLSSGSLAHDGTLTASVTVRNTGKRAGKEVVLLYVSDLYREVTPPNRELKGFRKIELQPGESTTASFTISPSDLAFVGLNNTWRTEPGTMRVTVGRLTRDFRLE